MVHLANILVASGNSGEARMLTEQLRGHGYESRVADSAEAALSLAQRSRPDIVLIGPDFPDGGWFKLAASLKEHASLQDLPVFVLTTDSLGEASRLALDVGVDDVMALPFHADELLARMRPLVRMGTMRTELLHRAAAATAFGVAIETTFGSSTDQGCNLLTVGNDLASLPSLFGPKATFTHTDNIYEAEDLLTRRNFDAAVVRLDAQPEECMGLCAQVRNNPRLFNLPILVIDDGGLDAVEAYRKGASRVLGAAVDADVLYGATLALVRRQQRRWAVRDLLQQTLRDATSDLDTGVYSSDFLRTYLDRRLAEARTEHRHLSLVMFRAPNVEGVRQQFGDEAAAHLLLQLGQWITGLLRAEDLTARYRDNEFCVVLPDTPSEEAEVVMHRIAGVLTYTDFAVRDVYQPVKVWVQVGSTMVAPGDDADTAIGRARHSLD